MNDHQNIRIECATCMFRMSSGHFLSKEEFDLIEENIVQLRFKKGELLVKQGAKATHIIYLTKGMVKHYYEDPRGKNIILLIKKAPHLIGTANMFNDGMHITSIAAIEDCSACLVDMTVFEKILRKNNDFFINFFKLVTDEFKSSVFDFISFSHKQVNGRIADIFLYFSSQLYRNAKFTLSLTRKEIAEYAGASQENVITILSKFDKEGIMKVDGKHIEILDFDRLKQISRLG